MTQLIVTGRRAIGRYVFKGINRLSFQYAGLEVAAWQQEENMWDGHCEWLESIMSGMAKFKWDI